MMKEKLDSLSQIILNDEKPGNLRAACFELYALFCEIVGLREDIEDTKTHDGTILSQGKAISPLNAALCVREYKRTSQFLRGVLAAINELKSRFPNEKIEILYAGIGPFATLITPLLGRFSPDELNLTLLDYHDFSIDAVKKIFHAFELEKFNPKFIRTDACSYKHPRRIHLIISETMQNALRNETQTAITLNLAPQLYENGIFVPQKIFVEAVFVNLKKEFGEKERIYAGKVLELDAENIRQKPSLDFPTVGVEIPKEAKERDLDLRLFTEIRIFGSFGLTDYQSSISYPIKIRPNFDIKTTNSVEFSYIIDEKPHFEHRIF